MARGEIVGLVRVFILPLMKEATSSGISSFRFRRGGISIVMTFSR